MINYNYKMTKRDQLDKNVKLSESLANYIAKKPESLAKYQGHSYVLFTKDDAELNKMNKKLVNDLVDEGKKVVKATKTKNRDNPWTFEPVRI